MYIPFVPLSLHLLFCYFNVLHVVFSFFVLQTPIITIAIKEEKKFLSFLFFVLFEIFLGCFLLQKKKKKIFLLFLPQKKNNLFFFFCYYQENLKLSSFPLFWIFLLLLPMELSATFLFLIIVVCYQRTLKLLYFKMQHCQRR